MGTAMGSPISGLITEAVLQKREKQLFEEYKPKFWARYVDDTFVIIDQNKINYYEELLNSIIADLQFTAEEEVDDKLVFLDVLVCRQTDGKLIDISLQLRGDLIQTYRIVRGRERAVDFDEFFKLAGNDRLRGHPLKLQRKLAQSDVRRNAFSHRFIGAWNGLPDAVVLSETVESFKCCTRIPTDYYPDTNGIFRRFHHHLKVSLRTADYLENWTGHLPLVLLGIRSTPKSDFDCSTAELVFGVTVRLPGEVISPTRRVAVEDPANLLHRLRQFIRTLSPVRPRTSVSESYLEKQMAKCSSDVVETAGPGSQPTRPLPGYL
ncbi:hypothetical protein SprV_0401710400 [Sparganum proliferum]